MWCVCHVVVNFHSIVALSDSLTLALLFQLVVTFILEIDTSILGHLVLAPSLSYLISTAHLSVAVSGNNTALASLACNAAGFFLNLLLLASFHNSAQTQ